MNKTKKDIVIDTIFLCSITFTENKAEATYEPTTQATIEETTEYITETIQEEEPTQAVTEPTETELAYTQDELEMLALVIYQEAGGDSCTDETRLMVGTVVMNRVEDSRFPDTIKGVLLQKQQYGRFYWTGLVWPSRASNPGEAHAVERAYKCAEQILSGYRAFGSDVIWQAEFVQGSAVVAYQDGIYFCK